MTETEEKLVEELQHRLDRAIDLIERHELDNRMLKTAGDTMLSELNRLTAVATENVTLRDHFAMSAMNALIIRDSLIGDDGSIFSRAYRIADEMLEERKVPKGN
jgi:hypothetical protein